MGHTCLREDLRTAILEAAGRLLERYGYKKMTMEDVAHEAGIGKGTIYLYFRSKEEMTMGWFDHSHLELQRALQTIADCGEGPDIRVRRMLVERVMFCFDTAIGFAQSLDDLFVAIRPSFFVRRNAYHAGDAEILGRVLMVGQEMGVFRQGDAFSAAECMLLATDSLLPYSLSVQQLGARGEIEEKAKRIAALLLDGMLVGPDYR
jgi:AcrR family transcriptional regulator